jgi:hypothetical protein
MPEESTTPDLVEMEESVDLGHGVVFSLVWEDGRLVGRDSHVQQRRGWSLCGSRT